MFGFSRARRLPVVLALLAGLIVLGVVLGHTRGARPLGGTEYTGTVYVETASGDITDRLPISFAIDSSGRHVERFAFPGGLPHSCRHRTLGRVAAGSAALLTPSHFEINLALSGTAGHLGTLEISGTFRSLNRESGAVATRFSSPSLRDCDASGGYTARGSS